MCIILPLFLFSSNANAWFFFFLPGSVTSAIADAITGSEGENCVGPNAKVGDTITIDGKLMTIKSLSGTSVRCKKDEFPIRALLDSSTAVLTQNTTQAKMDFPEGWESQQVSDSLKANGAIVYALNKTTDSGLLLSATKRSSITDMMAFANSQELGQASRLQDAQQSAITQLEINGLPAWRYEVTGKNKKSGHAFTYLHTIFEGDQEIVIVNVWSTQLGFVQQKESLLKIVDSLTGLSPPIDFVKKEEAKKKAIEEEAKKLAAEEDAKRIAAEEQAKRIATEEEAKQAKASASKKTVSRLPSAKQTVGFQQVDFNFEANKAARILGCQPAEMKVTGVEGGNILYLVACDDSKLLNLSCEPSGLCLQKKPGARSKL